MINCDHCGTQCSMWFGTELMKLCAECFRKWLLY